MTVEELKPAAVNCMEKASIEDLRNKWLPLLADLQSFAVSILQVRQIETESIKRSY